MKAISLLHDAEDPPTKEDLLELSKIIKSARRCVVILGAGVSVSSGLPDFRSPDGLFKLLVKKYPKAIVNGRDLFDASLFRDPTSTKLFYHFIGEFKELVDIARCTPTHCFLRNLDMRGQLLRCYTQNIDCLEERAGLITHFVPNRASLPEKMDALPMVKNESELRGLEETSPSEQRIRGEVSGPDNETEDALSAESPNDRKHTNLNYDEKISENAHTQAEIVNVRVMKSQRDEINSMEPNEEPNNGPERRTSFSSSITETSSTTFVKSHEAATATVSTTPALNLASKEGTMPRTVQLHGNLAHVICTQCRQRGEFDVNTRNAYKQGMAPPCPHCSEAEMVRSVAGMRSKGIGVLRPDVVLYNEFHPMGESIGNLSASDLRKRPDLLLVMGTSLKIPGVRRLVKEMAKSVHSRPSGRSIFVNRTPPIGTEWNNVFDYHVMGDSDVAVAVFEDAQLHSNANMQSSTTVKSTVEGGNVPKPRRKRKESPVVIVEASPKRGKAMSVAYPSAPKLHVSLKSTKTKSAGSSKDKLPVPKVARPDAISLTTRWKSTKSIRSSVTKSNVAKIVGVGQNQQSKSGRRISEEQVHDEG